MTISINPDRYSRSAEEQAALRELVARASAEAQENWDDPAWRRSMAARITEDIYFGYEHENVLDLLGTVENLPQGERSLVRETRGLKVHWMARGGKPEASTLNTKTFEILPDMLGFQVYEMEDKIKANFGETSQTLIDLSIRTMDAVINQRVFSLFQAATPSDTSNNNYTAGFSLGALNAALSSVRDKSLTREVTIVGRGTMTDLIMDELLGTDGNGGGFLPVSNEEFVRRGVIGTYRGANIVTLKNYLDQYDAPYIPGNELFVVARDASKFAFWGGLESKEGSDIDNWYWRFVARKSFGGIVHHVDRVHRIYDSSVDA